MSVPVAVGRMRTSPIQTVCASSPCSAPLYLTLLRQLRHGVVDPEPVLLVLGLVGEVDAVEVGRAAGARVLHVADQPDEVAAEGDHDLLEGRVPADDGVVLPAVHGAGRPVLHRDERDLRAVTDEHGDAAGVLREAGVVEDDGRLGERADLDDQLAPDDVVAAGAGQRQRHRSVELRLGGHAQRRSRRRRCAGSAPPAGRPARAGP